jgi:hypothetical protein
MTVSAQSHPKVPSSGMPWTHQTGSPGMEDTGGVQIVLLCRSCPRLCVPTWVRMSPTNANGQRAPVEAAKWVQ